MLATAIPRITSDFGGLGDVGWYGSAYLLTTMALLPTFGKVYMYFDIRFVLVASVLIFEVGSVVCAIATTSVVFILGRAIAGIGQAALLSGGMTAVARHVPIEKRAMYFAILTSMNGVASIIGPPLGGIFTDNPKLTWRFCFWINVREWPCLGCSAEVAILTLKSFGIPCDCYRGLLLQVFGRFLSRHAFEEEIGKVGLGRGTAVHCRHGVPLHGASTRRQPLSLV